jgi:hypothetical protein
MFIDKFISRIGTMKMTINQLIEKMKLINFDLKNHKEIVKYENFFYEPPKEDIDLVSRLQTKFAIPFIVEKFIVYSGESVSSMISKLYLNDFFRAYNESGNLKPSNSFIKKVFFYFGFEQFELQEQNNFVMDMYRLLKLYEDNSLVQDYILKTIGIDLEKFFIISYLLTAFIHSEKKQIQIIDKNIFKRYVLDGCKNIESNDIEKYFKFIGISRSDFIKKYELLRIKKNNDGTTRKLNILELQEIDRYLPKVSFQYPLLKIDNINEKYLLISYTSYTQFLKQERMFYHIYEHSNIPQFKSLIHGKALNDYIKYFASNNTNAIRVYGDEEYKLSKRKKYDAPDVIIEFEDYVIIIESKSKPFNLVDALHGFDDFNFERINKDCFTSVANIERYLYYVNDFKGKKIVKLLSYFFQNSVMIATSSEKNRPFNRMHEDEIIIANLKAIELFLNIKSKPHHLVIKEYVDEVNKNNVDSLYTFLIRNYNSETIIESTEEFKHKLFKKYLIN